MRGVLTERREERENFRIMVFLTGTHPLPQLIHGSHGSRIEDRTVFVLRRVCLFPTPAKPQLAVARLK